MKIAYLILCHKNISQVELLVNSLDDGNAYFFIHVDRKVESFTKIKLNNVFYLPDDKRLEIKWASYKMIQATLALAESCLKANVSFDYVVLLSGQDFPIKTKSEIRAFFSEVQSWNYIDVLNLNKSDPQYKRLEKRNSLRYPELVANNRLLRNAFIILTGGHKRTFSFIKKKKLNNLECYYGSQWWALQRECLSWMVSYVKANPDFESFFSSSLTPDESFFQTLFMASPYASKRKDKVVYMEWDGNHARIIDIEKAKELMIDGNKYLFARKFDMSTDENALRYVVSCMSESS